MRRVALGFLIGTMALQQMPGLPPLWWCWSLLLLIPACFYFARWRWLLCAGIAFCWANLLAHGYVDASLAPELEGQDVLATGYIASLPARQEGRTRFVFQPDSLRWRGQPQALPGKLLINWYQAAPVLAAGARWQLQLRLKQPHGFMNPGGFDYEAWLLREGIRATGYVRGGLANSANRPLAAAGNSYLLDQLRQGLQQKIQQALAGQPLRGVILALAIGDRQQVSNAQWQVFTRTGTNHLLAISGLHVGLVAGFAFFAGRRLWRCFPRALLLWPASKAGALLALSAASGYAMLAGFSVPTQRALLMIAVVMLGQLIQRRSRPSDLLALALLVVLLLDPFAVLAPGFWLSFAAVAVILLGMQRRLGAESSKWRQLWWRWGRVQWLVAVGLLPLLLLLFQQASLVSPLANFIAVPWVSLVTVPLTLLGVLAVWLWSPAGEFLLGLAAGSLQGLWWLLGIMQQWPLAQWQQGVAPLWAVLCALLGIAWLLMPRGMPARWLGALWILPLVLPGTTEIPRGQAHFALLDVGQGLASVVQTRKHLLVFDTGPRFPSGFNTGEAVLAPYLRQRGLQHIDLLVVSHGDLDHMGGALGLLQQIPARQVLSSVPRKLQQGGIAGVRACEAGQQWQWDGVQFTMLSPTPHTGGKGNNRSCVLKVTAGGESVLLSGDIERDTERLLVQTMAGKLPAEVLVAPHHGSGTSSSAAFLDAVSPRFALFAVGYRNRYGFPKPEILSRYRQRGIQLFDSARHGALEMRLGSSAGLQEITAFRQQDVHYWRHQLPAMGKADGQGASSGDRTSLLQ